MPETVVTVESESEKPTEETPLEKIEEGDDVKWLEDRLDVQDGKQDKILECLNRLPEMLLSRETLEAMKAQLESLTQLLTSQTAAQAEMMSSILTRIQEPPVSLTPPASEAEVIMEAEPENVAEENPAPKTESPRLRRRRL